MTFIEMFNNPTFRSVINEVEKNQNRIDELETAIKVVDRMINSDIYAEETKTKFKDCRELMVKELMTYIVMKNLALMKLSSKMYIDKKED